jgi:hypothetical protein
MKENESMQKKLMSQEEEFRLQNETLMKELAQVKRIERYSLRSIYYLPTDWTLGWGSPAFS